MCVGVVFVPVAMSVTMALRYSTWDSGNVCVHCTFSFVTATSFTFSCTRGVCVDVIASNVHFTNILAQNIHKRRLITT